ncbi:MAG: hypothetical protein J6J09_05190 [Phocaeicola sp.]|nr:hypothetical protein [Phocaeicola sp.]
MNRFLTLLLIGCVGLISPTSAQQTNKLSKIPNISLNATGTREHSSISYLNIGLMTNVPFQRGIGINVFSSVVQQKMTGLQLSGLGNIVVYEANGIQIAGVVNASRDNSNGLHIAGLMNVAGNKLRGLHISTFGNVGGRYLNGISIGGLINMTGGTARALEIGGLANFVGERQYGMAIAGLMNVSGDGLSGMQTAGLLNISGNETKGVQIAGVGNISVNSHGLQIAGLSNVATDMLKGVQIAGVTNIAVQGQNAFQISSIANIAQQGMKGVQLGVANYAGNLTGAQVGILNLCGGDVKGVQIGVINHSKDTTALKIGLVNVNPSTRIQVLTYGGNLSKFNLAVRFRNHSLYTMLGFGTHFLGLNEKFSGTLFYRAGTIYDLTQKLSISGDIGFYHIESFENENTEIPERMYSLQPRLNIEYAISKKFGLFLSGGYSWTRHYDKNKSFGNKALLEFGVTLL